MSYKVLRPGRYVVTVYLYVRNYRTKKWIPAYFYPLRPML